MRLFLGIHRPADVRARLPRASTSGKLSKICNVWSCNAESPSQLMASAAPGRGEINFAIVLRVPAQQPRASPRATRCLIWACSIRAPTPIRAAASRQRSASRHAAKSWSSNHLRFFRDVKLAIVAEEFVCPSWRRIRRPPNEKCLTRN